METKKDAFMEWLGNQEEHKVFQSVALDEATYNYWLHNIWVNKSHNDAQPSDRYESEEHGQSKITNSLSIPMN